MASEASPTTSVHPLVSPSPVSEAPELLEEVAVSSLDAEDLGELAGDDRQGQADDEALEHGLGDEAREEAQPEQPGGDGHDAVVIASATVSARKSPDPPAAKSDQAAAERAAVAAMGPAIRCFELPKAA